MLIEELMVFSQMDASSSNLQLRPSIGEALAAVRVSSLRLRRMLEGMVRTIDAAHAEGDVSGYRSDLLLAHPDAKHCFKVGEVYCLPLADDRINDETIDILSILDLLVQAVDVARSEQHSKHPEAKLVEGREFDESLKLHRSAEDDYSLAAIARVGPEQA